MINELQNRLIHLNKLIIINIEVKLLYEYFKTKDKILAALGNMRAMRRLHVDTYTEEKIKNISGVKIAESKKGNFG